MKFAAANFYLNIPLCGIYHLHKVQISLLRSKNIIFRHRRNISLQCRSGIAGEGRFESLERRKNSRIDL